jgi:hypothetical protein
MARFYGEVGFGDTVETVPGVWEGVITERKFSGDVLRNTYQSNTSDKVNDDVTLSNSISIVGNKYAFDHLKDIRYVKFEGECWTVDSIEVRRPRLILSLGGVYNGRKTGTSGTA